MSTVQEIEMTEIVHYQRYPQRILIELQEFQKSTLRKVRMRPSLWSLLRDMMEYDQSFENNLKNSVSQQKAPEAKIHDAEFPIEHSTASTTGIDIDLDIQSFESDENSLSNSEQSTEDEHSIQSVHEFLASVTVDVPEEMKWHIYKDVDLDYEPVRLPALLELCCQEITGSQKDFFRYGTPGSQGQCFWECMDICFLRNPSTKDEVNMNLLEILELDEYQQLAMKDMIQSDRPNQLHLLASGKVNKFHLMLLVVSHQIHEHEIKSNVSLQWMPFDGEDCSEDAAVVILHFRSAAEDSQTQNGHYEFVSILKSMQPETIKTINFWKYSKREVLTIAKSTYDRE